MVCCVGNDISDISIKKIELWFEFIDVWKIKIILVIIIIIITLIIINNNKNNDEYIDGW